MLSLTDALKQMHDALRSAGYSSGVIKVHLRYADIDAVQREDKVVRAIIEESLHPKMEKLGEEFGHVRPLGIVNDVHLYIQGRKH